VSATLRADYDQTFKACPRIWWLIDSKESRHARREARAGKGNTRADHREGRVCIQNLEPGAAAAGWARTVAAQSAMIVCGRFGYGDSGRTRKTATTFCSERIRVLSVTGTP